MGQFDCTVNVMLFEGGAIIGSLHANTQGQQLANKIESADRQALAAGQTSFDLSLDPIEVGIAIQSLDGCDADLAKSLSAKLRKSLADLMSANNIGYGPGAGTPSGGLDGQGGEGSSSPSPSTGLGEDSTSGASTDAPASDPSTGQTSDGTTDGSASAPADGGTETTPSDESSPATP